MAYQPSISDLNATPNAPPDAYRPSLSDLNIMSTIPTQPEQAAPSSGNNGIMDMIRKILPTPSMPLGMNVAAGALSSFMPPAQRNAFQQSPQMASGEHYGLPQQIASGIGQSFPALMAGGPNLMTQAIAGFGTGAQQAPEGQKLKSGFENALSTTLLGKVIPAMGNFVGKIFNPITDKDLATNVQGIHDAIDNQASQGFQDVGKGVAARGVSQVPLPLSVMSDLSSAIKAGYLPNKKSTNDMINNALTGDYNALRKMQTELWNKGTKAASSTSVADNNMAEEIFDLRDRINGSVSNHLLRTGHEDLNDTLNASRAGYKYLQDTFYNKNITPQIKKLVNPDIRQVPKNLGNILQQDSIPMENVRNAISRNPDNNWLGNNAMSYPTDIQSYNFHKSIGPVMKGLGIGSFGLGEALGLYKLFQNHPSHD
ncbi:MAG: hypothetical protein PHV62_05790 [Sulfuricurvum sp.]|nr:hypothetical protein [Sulfuricurvum sp.]